MSKAKMPGIIKDDIWLAPYQKPLEERIKRYQQGLETIARESGDLLTFSNAHRFLGFNYDSDKKGWYYREWAPGAYALMLIGDFNDWNRQSHPLEKKSNGVWEIFLPDRDYAHKLIHESLVKVHVRARNGQLDRIPAYIKRVVQDPASHDFVGQFWNPPSAFQWADSHYHLKEIKKAPLIYEAHIGIASENETVSTYKEFTEQILPRIKKAGYNTIQLMAIQEHPYYGSFGYHVSNFFAPTSRFGTPDELKTLVNTAHKMGLTVIMDLVHSHAVKNEEEGISRFDGTYHQYFHAGARGDHPAWDSRCFNYAKEEVVRFLLSNCKYWLEEFHFDGFRFDGVTSMLYLHHGLDKNFVSYADYFTGEEDIDAITYLTLANQLIHEVKPNALSVAEEMSGYPGLTAKPEEWGVGFDYRLSMGVPDLWIKLIKEKSDENWNVAELFHELTQHRPEEKIIAYAESHDQALVGDKTIIFRLADKEMYHAMQKESKSLIIDRAIALHKIIRLVTIGTGYGGYLNF